MFALIFSFFFKNSFQQCLKVNWPSYNTYVVRGFIYSQLATEWVLKLTKWSQTAVTRTLTGIYETNFDEKLHGIRTVVLKSFF